MLSVFKKTTTVKNSEQTINYSSLMVDMHSHVLPGIDDGAKTTADSIVLIRKMMDAGIQKIIATPHIMADYYKNTPETICAALTLLKSALKEENIYLDITAAAEHYLDENMEKLIAKKALLTMGDHYVLFEIPFISKPANLVEMIMKMREAHYKPILAHPERYSYFDVRDYKVLKNYGCLLQLNTISLTGYNGREVKKAAEKLVDNNLVDFISSDIHHTRHANAFEAALQMPYVIKLIKNHALKNTVLCS